MYPLKSGFPLKFHFQFLVFLYFVLLSLPTHIFSFFQLKESQLFISYKKYKIHTSKYNFDTFRSSIDGLHLAQHSELKQKIGQQGWVGDYGCNGQGHPFYSTNWDDSTFFFLFFFYISEYFRVLIILLNRNL